QFDGRAGAVDADGHAAHAVQGQRLAAAGEGVAAGDEREGVSVAAIPDVIQVERRGGVVQVVVGQGQVEGTAAAVVAERDAVDAVAGIDVLDRDRVAA